MRQGLLIILLFIANTCDSQQSLHIDQIYSLSSGLSDQTTQALEMDSRGFLWIGTREGLNRFDGFRFVTYYYNRNDPNTLSNNNVLDILEYQPGQLLIATGNGLSVLNTLSGRFENEKLHHPQMKAGSGVTITSLYKHPSGNIWVNHSGELDILDSNLNYLYRFTDQFWAVHMKGIQALFDPYFLDKQGRLWIGSDTSGIHMIDFAQKKVFNKKYNPYHWPFLQFTFIRSIYFDDLSNALFFGPWGEGLFKYDFKNSTLTEERFGTALREESSSVNCILPLKGDYCIISIKGKLLQVNLADLTYKQIHESKINQTPILNGITMLKDPDQQVWTGSSEGLVRISNLNSGLEIINLQQTTGMADATICTDMQLSPRRTVLAVLSDNSILECNVDGSTLRRFQINNSSDTRLTRISEDIYGNTWLGTTKGLFHMNIKTAEMKYPDLLPDVLKTASINFIFCDSKNNTWILTRDPFRLFRYEPSGKKYVQIYNSIIRHFESLQENSRISFIAEDSMHQIWMSSLVGGGLVHYDPLSDNWSLYPADTNSTAERAWKAKSLQYVQPQVNRIWTSESQSGGLLLVDLIKNERKYFGRQDGILSDRVRYACPGDSGILWLITDRGITRFDQHKLRAISNIVHNVGASFGRQAVFDPVSKNLIACTADEILIVNSRQPLLFSPLPAPVVDKIWINGIEQFLTPTHGFKELKYNQNNISIDFTAIRFNDPDKIRFAYKLEGINEEWKIAGRQQSVQYSSLSPGNYNFLVKLSDENHDWGPEHSLISFTIVPPYWQTWWFKTLLSLIAAALLYILVSRRIQAVRKEAMLKHKITETEMQALRAQMNPHFIFNCLNAIDNLIQTNQKEKATTYLARFARLIRNVMDSSKNNLVLFQKDLETLQLYLQMEQFRSSNKFSYTVHADEELMQGDYKVPPLVAQPFIENAIQHGLLNKLDGDKMLGIEVKLKNDFIHYIITDNGVGRERALEIKELNRPEHQSYGIAITKERIHLYNQNGDQDDIIITDLVQGTKVEIKIKAYDNN